MTVDEKNLADVLATIPEAVELIGKGKMIIVVDDEDRENEGDLVISAELCTKEDVNFMTKNGRGLICVPMKEDRANELDLVPMVSQGTDPLGTAFTVSVDLKEGTTTGISVDDRTKTIRALANFQTKSFDFSRPGHIFPLVAKKGGVLRRAGHTEASVDLAEMAGLRAVSVICEILNDDGSMARLSDLVTFAKKHDFRIVTIKDLIAFRRQTEELINPAAVVEMPTRFGMFKMHAFEEVLTGDMHLALVKGEVADGKPVLVRAHSECLTGDLFHSFRCDCGEQLEAALEFINKEGRGVLLYMRQEGRGIGLKNKLKAYALQEQGLDTVEANASLGFKADLREYGIGAQILVRLGLSKLRLMTNNPKKIIGLSAYGLTVVERVELPMQARKENQKYLEVKRDKLGHMIRKLGKR
ncbi:MAG: bifunctional 3,4-dihydroxy-2-butanone-4-phosphate synthase/GTP cyclohydrolase II [Candidatus Lindowbacteria bacterium]|nr:bifunctional 3,4-dihydroxy-2-butanone-4-phosphate synthase/GTP cyclohydrolase II [Candidatus Lindowbacteria bacterium]